MQARARAGALDFDTGEVRAVMDCQGHVVDLAPHHPGRASRLIEELMIASNRTVARALDSAGLPSLRRVVRRPERWARIVAYAGERGFSLPQEPSSQELARFVDAMRRSRPVEEFAEISVALVKLIGRGEYVAYTPGRRDGDQFVHFGLATDQYTHSTAPNRRYPDLLTQRLVGSLLASRPAPYSLGELDALAAHCSQREADAQKVERRVRKSLEAQVLASRIGESFSGLVTGASPKGTWARLLSPAVEGRIVEGEAGLRVGDRVELRLRSVSVERGHIDLVVA
jgi:exoribonuclease-2